MTIEPPRTAGLRATDPQLSPCSVTLCRGSVRGFRPDRAGVGEASTQRVAEHEIYPRSGLRLLS
jgi:hypothetical protein